MYALDGAGGNIARYASNQPSKPFSWLAQSSQKPVGAANIAVDGNVWVATASGEVQRYFKGEYKDAFSVLVFPSLVNVQDISTNERTAYLALLEPAQNRVVFVEKETKEILLYQGVLFQTAKAIMFSDDGNSLYVETENTVYEIQNTFE